MAARYLWYSGVPGCGPGACSRDAAAALNRLPLLLAVDNELVTDGAADIGGRAMAAGGRWSGPTEEEGVEARMTGGAAPLLLMASAGMPMLLGVRGVGLPLLVRTRCGVGGNGRGSAGGPSRPAAAAAWLDPWGAVAAAAGTEEAERLETESFSCCCCCSLLLLRLPLSSPSSEMSE